ncbi:MAG: TRAP transporter TatT component family protein [Pseudomonadota bacterium]
MISLLSLGFLPGCSKIVSSATNSFAGALSAGILNQDDLETVRDGAPAYLLLVDGFIAENPDNEALLLAGADLYGSYAGAFVDDAERSQRLAARAVHYARRALCGRNPALCEQLDASFESFESALDESTEAEQLNALYGLGSAWATSIQLNSGDWNAIASIPKVEALMEKVIELDPEFQRGWPHLYMGVVTSQLPPAYGGKPEVGQGHFEAALKQSERRNLMVQVLYASEYARLVFDQELHDRLLDEVLAAEPEEPNLTLINTIAQKRAKELREQGSDYF